MTPAELVIRAKHLGFNGICITDHDQVWDREFIERLAVQNDFLVIGGVEVRTDCGEILVFGLHQSVLKVYEAAQLRDMVDRAGGVMIAAHPLRGDFVRLTSKVTTDTFISRPIFQFVDAVEVENGLSGMEEVDVALGVASRLGLPGTGGSDAHAILAVGSCYTAFEREIACEEDLIREIKAGRCWGERWDPNQLTP
jgi:predicted metal-dependent phosphoesterase TrpH